MCVRTLDCNVVLAALFSFPVCVSVCVGVCETDVTGVVTALLGSVLCVGVWTYLNTYMSVGGVF